jgi:ferredoxin
VLNLDALEKLLGSDDAPIRLNGALCINLRHKERACAKCVACPTDAITITGTRVEFDANKCVACGLCAAVCPTNAFTTQQTDGAILDAFGDAAPIEFACKRASGTRAPNVAGVMTLTCLARMSPDLLTALGAEHARVWLNDAPCAACPIGARTHPQIVAMVDAATHLLAAWNRGDALKRYTESETELIETRALQRAGDAEISRREMFSFFKSNLGRAAGLVVAASLGDATKSNASAPVNTMERARARLGAPTSEYVASARFATLEVAAYCTACGLCAKICPSKAIEFRSKEGYFVLGFEPPKCIGVECSLCKMICPAHAITLSPGATREDVNARDQKVLRAGSLTVCVKCFTPFATEPGESFCPACRAIEANAKTLANELFKKRIERISE